MQYNKNIRAFFEVISKMELIDMEVDWKINYLHINSFRHIEKDSEEYLGWIGKKIKIKYLGGFDKNYDSQMNPLIEEVRNEFQDLDPHGRKIFIDRINQKLQFIRDCIDNVIEVQSKFKHDKESFNDDYFAPTMRLTTNFFIEKLSEPLKMGLARSYYQTRDFTNDGETIYMSNRLLKAIYNNLRAREYSLVEVLEIYPSVVRMETVESSQTNIQAEESEPKVKPKQPTARVIMAFVNLINDRENIIPKNGFRNNDEKFSIASLKIKKLFGYQYAGGTLEKEQYEQEGYSTNVYNLLIEWKYNTEALKYKNEHNG